MSAVHPSALATRAAIPTRAAYLADVVKSRRIQIFCAWCGPVFTVLLFGGWGLMAGFIPLISPHDTIAQVASAWRDHHFLMLLGLTIAMFGIALTLPFYLGISAQMRRTELRLPILSVLQLVGYLNIWVGFLLMPANTIIFFKTGPFAWTGVIGFWMPAAIFGTWYFVVTYVLLKAIRQEEREDRAQLEATACVVPGAVGAEVG